MAGHESVGTRNTLSTHILSKPNYVLGGLPCVVRCALVVPTFVGVGTHAARYASRCPRGRLADLCAWFGRAESRRCSRASDTDARCQRMFQVKESREAQSNHFAPIIPRVSPLNQMPGHGRQRECGLRCGSSASDPLLDVEYLQVRDGTRKGAHHNVILFLLLSLKLFDLRRTFLRE